MFLPQSCLDFRTKSGDFNTDQRCGGLGPSRGGVVLATSARNTI